MKKIEDLSVSEGDISHDMGVNFSTHEYTGEPEDIFLDSVDIYRSKFNDWG